MLHRIRQQIIEIELPREAGAVALQRRVSRIFQDQVLPRLDEAFSRIAPADRVVRIDRLNLDLGDITETNWERDFVEKCVTQIAEQVAEAAFNVGGEHQTETWSAEENALAVFQYFLERGALPWYAQHLTLSLLEQMVRDALSGGSTFWRQELRRILKDKPEALQRLEWQFNGDFSEKIMDFALGVASGWMHEAIQIRQSQTGQKMTAREFLVFSKHLLSVGPGVLSNTPLSRDGLAQTALEEIPDVATPPIAKPIPDLKGIPVDNSGLVLLAVYLPPFFKKLGIELEPPINQSPINQSPITNHHHRAVHLLHYIATGRIHPDEPLLVLPKILSGLALETAVPQNFDLSDEEKLEANRLLEAIVRNWPVLKNTSPDGLRSGFLQRAGILSWSESRNSWVLRVERLGQDLLLEKVPWSYSVVRLPWMGEMVAVEW